MINEFLDSENEEEDIKSYIEYVKANPYPSEEQVLESSPNDLYNHSCCKAVYQCCYNQKVVKDNGWAILLKGDYNALQINYNILQKVVSDSPNVVKIMMRDIEHIWNELYI